MYRVIGWMFYGLSASSVALSLTIWLQRQKRPTGFGQVFWRPNYEATEHAGIFVGLWAPTFAIAGKAIEDLAKRTSPVGTDKHDVIANRQNDELPQNERATSRERLRQTS